MRTPLPFYLPGEWFAPGRAAYLFSLDPGGRNTGMGTFHSYARGKQEEIVRNFSMTLKTLFLELASLILRIHHLSEENSQPSLVPKAGKPRNPHTSRQEDNPLWERQ